VTTPVVDPEAPNPGTRVRGSVRRDQRVAAELARVGARRSLWKIARPGPRTITGTLRAGPSLICPSAGPCRANRWMTRLCGAG